ncbi:MAG TPA: hypothetical protein VL128_19090 [Candidatus Eisenbacteria bacterium]|nr:hypothetical protein [Candidatus Eisenbacteria bacterium]
MNYFRGCLIVSFAAVWAATTLFAGTALAQSAAEGTSAKSEQWIHVRVENKQDHGETVRVNVPVEMAEKVLPAINKDRLHDGKVRIDSAHLNDVDLRAILDAVRSSKDGEYVTVESRENNVRVAKKGGYLYVHVTDRGDWEKGASKDAASAGKAASHESKVEVKVPMKVVDALLSAGKDELDLVAALRVLSAHGDTDLVTVNDDENIVRVWVDSKNASD